MAQYSFVTEWKIEAPIERVWQAIFDLRSGRNGGWA